MIANVESIIVNFVVILTVGDFWTSCAFTPWRPRNIRSGIKSSVTTLTPIMPSASFLDKVQNDISRYVRSVGSVELSDFMTYYNLKTPIMRKIPSRKFSFTSLLGLPPALNIENLRKILRGRFGGGPCHCAKINCTCCSHLHLTDQTCMNITYNPYKTLIDMKVVVANKKVIGNATYGPQTNETKCVDLPVANLRTFLDVCIGFYNVTRENDDIHMCMAVDTRINRRPSMVLFFDCVVLGPDQPESKPTKITPYYKIPKNNQKFPRTPPPGPPDKPDDFGSKSDFDSDSSDINYD